MELEWGKDKCHFVLKRNLLTITKCGIQKYTKKFNGCYSFCYMTTPLSQPWSEFLFAISSFSVSRLYKPCTVHVTEFNAKNDVILVWSLPELLVSTQTFSLTSVDYSIRTLSFMSKSDKSTWPVRSCLIHTTCQKINNNCEFGRWQIHKREHYL